MQTAYNTKETEKKPSDLQRHVMSIVNDIEQGITITKDNQHDFDSDYDIGDTLNGWDYLNDILDIEYYMSSDRQTVLGARILVAFGGPNIWIDTRFERVEGYWWGDKCIMTYHEDTMNIGDCVADMWGC
jgi:hypothetical protein